MKNYCDKCKVEIDENVAYCPLCGRCCREELIGEDLVFKNFPNDTKFIKSKEKAFRAIISLLVWGNLLSIASELFFSGTFTWSFVLLISTIFAFIGIIFPIKNNWSSVNYHSIFYLCFFAFIIFLENYTNSFGWGVQYVIPLFCLAFALYNFYMVLSNIKNRYEHIIPMLILMFTAIGVFIFNYAHNYIMWPSITAFFTTIGFTILLLVFKSTKIGKALFRKVHF